MPSKERRLARAVELELWVARVRLLAIAFAIVEVGVIRQGFPAGYYAAAWAVTALFALGPVLLFVATKRTCRPEPGRQCREVLTGRRRGKGGRERIERPHPDRRRGRRTRDPAGGPGADPSRSSAVRPVGGRSQARDLASLAHAPSSKHWRVRSGGLLARSGLVFTLQLPLGASAQA